MRLPGALTCGLVAWMVLGTAGAAQAAILLDYAEPFYEIQQGETFDVGILLDGNDLTLDTIEPLANGIQGIDISFTFDANFVTVNGVGNIDIVDPLDFDGNDTGAFLRLPVVGGLGLVRGNIDPTAGTLPYDGTLLVTVSLTDLGVAAIGAEYQLGLGEPTIVDGNGTIFNAAGGDIAFGSSLVRIVPVPEPGTGLLVSAGCLLLGALRRRDALAPRG